ncbi:UNVERIFIED_CONTAM: hypothetical protein Sradi_3332100 [Sesamum radiatum]|uniref:Uncharacterized protein n=1 Tax=Sesamum radiatum TaxID=300843 RepID=A0AAW2R2S5_SESRA
MHEAVSDGLFPDYCPALTAGFAYFGTSTTGMFIGNVPLNTNDTKFGMVDKFVVAFNNSSRKTLLYIPSVTQNGEIIVRPSLEMVREGSCRWAATAVTFLGRIRASIISTIMCG